MAVKRFMIAPLDSGLQTETKPWLQADDAYERLDNAYLYYGRIRKRVGATVMNTGVNPLYAQLYSRLGMQIGVTDGAGNFAGVIPGAGANGQVGQIFGVGTQALGHEIFTIITQAAGVNPMLATDAGNGTFNTATGAVVINASVVNAPVYWYPAFPVMGLPQYELGPINDRPTFGFDTHYAYIFTDRGNGNRWEILSTPAFVVPPAAGTYVATGADFNFVWPLNYQGPGADITALFATNNVDPIRYFINGTGWNAVPYLPQWQANAAQTIQTAKCIAYFKGRLILFNTLENQTVGPAIRFPQRARWTSPAISPFILNTSFNAGLQQTANFDDAPIAEQIVSVSMLKDRLIVFFEQTTMELVFTGNAADPFRFQSINSELGVESTFSPVLFDKGVIGVGNVGVHVCNGTNVERIDEKIRQTVFQIKNADNGKERVYGIRDYANELVYWTYPDETAGHFPTRVLVYNYRKAAWAQNDDSITCFGYFQNTQNYQWNNFNVQWQEAQLAWNAAGWEDEYTNIIAGNQEGFTFILDTEISKNSAALSITNIGFANPNAPVLGIIAHNLLAGDFIYIESVRGVNVADFNGVIFEVINVVDGDNIQIARADTAGQLYAGGGTVTVVSRIDILTKQYNFFQQDGRNAYVSKVDFNVDRTANGEITIDFLTSTSNRSLLNDGLVTGSILGTSVLETTPYAIYPFEATQTQLWHPVYLQAEGEYVQLRIYYSDAEMFQPNVAFEDFELNAFTIYAEPTSTRLQ